MEHLAAHRAGRDHGGRHRRLRSSIQLEEQRQQACERERVARTEAEQLSRMKDDFIAVLSHELRTPLTRIMGWAHVLQAKRRADEVACAGWTPSSATATLAGAA